MKVTQIVVESEMYVFVEYEHVALSKLPMLIISNFAIVIVCVLCLIANFVGIIAWVVTPLGHIPFNLCLYFVHPIQ